MENIATIALKADEESLMEFRLLKSRVLKKKCVSSLNAERFTKDLV